MYRYIVNSHQAERKKVNKSCPIFLFKYSFQWYHSLSKRKNKRSTFFSVPWNNEIKKKIFLLIFFSCAFLISSSLLIPNKLAGGYLSDASLWTKQILEHLQMYFFHFFFFALYSLRWVVGGERRPSSEGLFPCVSNEGKLIVWKPQSSIWSSYSYYFIGMDIKSVKIFRDEGYEEEKMLC